MHPSYGSKEKGLEDSFGIFLLVISSKVIFPMHTTALACHQQLDTVLNLGKRKRDVHKSKSLGKRQWGE
jgi:hypothetical protein